MAHSATELDTATLFGARRVTYRSWSSGSMPRSMSRTGISASCARLRDSSQPEPSVADSRIRSTPSSMNELNASIWDFWSRLAAGANFSVKPASSVNVSWMSCSFAWRQAPSGPTATKPMVTGSSEPPPVLASPDEQAARTVPTSQAALRPRTERRLSLMGLLLEIRGASRHLPGFDENRGPGPERRWDTARCSKNVTENMAFRKPSDVTKRTRPRVAVGQARAGLVGQARAGLVGQGRARLGVGPVRACG